MNKFKPLLIITLLLAITTSLTAQISFLDKTVATVNLNKPERISQIQLNNQVEEVETLRAQMGQAGSVDRRQVLELLISDILLKQALERDNVRVSSTEVDEAVNQQKAQIEAQNNVRLTDEQFKNAVESQTGASWDEFRSQLELQIAQQRYLLEKKADVLEEARIPPTYQEINMFYRKNRNEFSNPDIVRFSHIFISTVNLSASQRSDALRQAEEAYRKYTNGTDFQQLVMEYTDDEQRMYRGGDAGYMAINDTRPGAYFGQDFVDKVFLMDKGDVSSVLTSKLGYHIVKVTEYHPAKLLALTDTISPESTETVQEYIAQLLIGQKNQLILQKALEQLIEELKSQAEINIFEENLE
ncbi:MAG: peptidylprolyl isomerase [Spirochaetales bacterium]|nr:peptidylprolyl isomerase [Spirochaetales bacterium]